MGNDEHGPAYPEPPVYRCPICRGDENRYMRCGYPGCPDGHDRYHPHRTTYREVLEPTKPSFVSLAPFLAAFIAALLLFMFMFWPRPAPAMDHGFDPLAPTTKWMESLQRPFDRPGSCCGIADAYQADTYTRHPDGSYTVVITEGSGIAFPDGTHRTPLANGTVIEVPADHVNPPTEQSGNPTGHAWLFLSVYGIYDGNTETTETKPGTIYCFIPLPDGS